MISVIYMEEAVAEHPVSVRIRQRFRDIAVIPVQRYGEVFNRKGQNFRLQKTHPALILAQKFDGFVLPTPSGYGIGSPHNYYMSHMLNCIYDCRYCFLQGMYRSAHYVLFVNYENFQEAMRVQLEKHLAAEVGFFSGYDCDSLALEPVSGYVENLLPFFDENPRAKLELRTKSTQVRALLRRPPADNVVVAFSFTPQRFASALEHKVPAVAARIAAMQRVASHGWPIGLRFDPLLFDTGYRESYSDLFKTVFGSLDISSIHSVSLGPFRLPRDFFKTVERLYPYEPLLAAEFSERNGIVSYPEKIEQEMIEFCTHELLQYIPDELLFRCDF